MASAVLFSRNQSDWPQSRHGFMAEALISNPNSSSGPVRDQVHRGSQIQMPVSGRCVDSGVDFDPTSMNNGLSMNQKQPKINGSNGFYHCGYVSFDIASMSRKEAIELKRRLVSELERIRDLAARIDSGQLGQRNNRKGLGVKRGNRPQFPPPGRESKRFASDAANARCLKACRGALGRLMKHKHSWIFNSPVDIVGMGLHDYNQIVKKPMDLGTVKSNLGNNMYINPLDFASDVRLTFDNAMLYNPKGHDVYTMAETLKSRFEEIFWPVYQKFANEQRELRSSEGDDELQGSSWNPNPSPEKCCSPQVLGRRFDLVQTSASTSNPDPVYPPHPHSPRTLPPGRHHPVVAKANYGRVPKPKARDPNKREMNMDEKQQLGIGLQSLPQEKMIQVLQIIRKRNGQVKDEGDEIELDIEAIDVETLWELDRFVTNWKKMASKMRRQSLVGENAAASDRMDEIPETSIDGKEGKAGSDGGDEDVDIGEDIPATSFPPLEIERDVAQGSSSSSSSTSDSSSSSDSESGSSSGSDSDADVQSRRMSM